MPSKDHCIKGLQLFKNNMKEEAHVNVKEGSVNVLTRKAPFLIMEDAII